VPDAKQMLSQWVRKQIDLGTPDPIFSPGFSALLKPPAPTTRANPLTAAKTTDSSATSASGPLHFSAPVSASIGKPMPRAKPLSNLGSFAVLQPAGFPAAPAIPGSSKREAMKKLFFESKTCTRCPLGKSRKNFVFGSGNVDAPLLVIGEAPGADEDEQGLPFVGRAGKLLTEMLAAIGLDRQKDVFIANVLKCRPPANRTPESEEIAACLPLLKKQIEIMRPKAILLLGKIAINALLSLTDSLSKLRKDDYAYDGIPVRVTYHPAALLRDASYKRPAWEDLQRLQKLLKELNAYGS
jgi:uracil-DNA glycosylase